MTSGHLVPPHHSHLDVIDENLHPLQLVNLHHLSQRLLEHDAEVQATTLHY